MFFKNKHKYNGDKIQIESVNDGYSIYYRLKSNGSYLKKFNYDSQGGSYDMAIFYKIEDARNHREMVENGFLDLIGRHTGKKYLQIVE